MKKSFFLPVILMLLLPAIGHAQSVTKRDETFAIIGFFIAAAIGIAIYWVQWNKNKDKSNGSKDKFKVKTFEVMKNGRKVVMTKKYRVTSEEEFPEAVKRKK